MKVVSPCLKSSILVVLLKQIALLVLRNGHTLFQCFADVKELIKDYFVNGRLFKRALLHL